MSNISGHLGNRGSDPVPLSSNWRGELNAPPIGMKLGVAFTLLVGILIGIGVLGLDRMDQVNAHFDDVLGRRLAKLQLAREALMYSNQNSRITMEIFLVNDKARIDQLLAQRAKNTQQISELVEKIKAQCVSADECQLLADVENARIPYINSYVRALHLLVEEKQPETARTVMVQQTTPALYTYHKAWSKFLQFQMEQMDKAANESRAHYTRTRGTALLLLLLAVIVAVTIAFFVTLKMTDEMRRRVLVEHEMRVLNSKLEQRVEQRTQDLTHSNQQLTAQIAERKSAEGRLRLQVAALEAAANSIVITNVRGEILWVNSAFTRLTGYSAEEARGQNPRLLRSGKHDSSFYANLWKTISSGEVWHGEITNRRKDGSLYDEEMTITPVRADSGDISHFVAIKQDITERKRAEEALREAKERYRLIFEENSMGICQSTLDGRYLSVNPAFARMFGYDSPEEMIASVKPKQLYVDDNCRRELARLLREQYKFEDREFQVYRKDGNTFWVRGTARAVRGSDGRVLYYVGAAEDITARKTAEEQVEFLAYYDALTGLPNRTLFQDRLAKALASARRRGEKLALIFLDLDNFKTINDSLGHSVGDLLLKKVAERLDAWARAQDTVARLSGDEFVVLLTGVKDVASVAVAADRILKAMTAEFILQGQSLNVACSLGISVFPDNGADAETLVKHADAALYSAKESGNRFQFFTQDMNARAVERLTLESSLRLALEREEFFLVYQPQVDLATGGIIGAEALLRWRHPQLGLVPPDKFIPIAEKSGLILPIGEWVLRTACAQARQWQDEGLPPLPVAVNVSAVQFRQDRFLHVIRSVLDETGLHPQYLELELTEGLLLSNADLTLAVLQELKRMGLKLSIDDFGTGYSSLSYLRQFPVHRLKIDRSFVQAMTVDADAAAITGTIINMARSLRLKVIAEGVENEEQLLLLRAHACDEVQGYYFSRPLTPADFADKVRDADFPPSRPPQATHLLAADKS